MVNFIKEIPLFGRFSRNRLKNFIVSLYPMNYLKNDIIIKEGTSAKRFFIVKAGIFSVSKKCKNGDIN
jgi:CRP-like cAMP-binding protein